MRINLLTQATPFLVFFLLLPLFQVAQTRFQSVPATHTGIAFENRITDRPEHNILIYSNYYGGAGVGVGDFNADGLPDLFFAGNLVADELYLNQGDFRFAQPQDAGIVADQGWSSGVVVADVNHDGWPDIYVTRELYDDDPERRKNLLYLNDGDGTFTEVGQKSGVADPGRSRHAVFFDYDRDGDLDLYVLNQPPNPGNYSPLLGTDLKLPDYRSKLYRNEGNGADGLPNFTEVGPASGLADVGFPNSVLAADFDQDGHTDLYVSHDYDAPDRLYHNNGDGTFTNLIHTATGHTSYYSMGVDGADLNRDGLLDLMVLDMVAEDNYRLKANMSGMNPAAFTQVVQAGGHYQYMFNSLQLNRGANAFSEVAHLAGVEATDWSWANLFADFDNDGHQDLFVTNGLLRDIRNTDAAKTFATHVSQKINAYIAAHPNDADVTLYDVIDLDEALGLIPSQPLSNYAFRNNGDLTFSKKTDDWGLGQPGFSNGAAYADLDGDGQLDLVVSNINAPASIYRNTGGKAAQEHYLRLQLEHPLHKTTLGTNVSVSTGEGAQFFTTTNVRGMYSTSEGIVHIGLGEATSAAEVKVSWPDGLVTKLKDVPANQLLTVTHGDGNFYDRSAPPEPLLEDITKTIALPYRHRENVFDDYHYQVLLPHQQSRNGPALAVGDINGDGLDDLYLGGASGQAGELYQQEANGSFTVTNTDLWRSASLLEDIAAAFFDSDGDGDLDLYVVSGGNEFEAGSPFYRDRLYLNDGAGKFTTAPDRLPDLFGSGSCVVPGDYDGDGDLDLFVGGRLIPRDYPAPAPSYLLRNDAGVFTDVSQELSDDFAQLGLVTAAEWTDLDGDGRQDLLVVGEWMPLTVFYNRGDRFERSTDFTDLASGTTGWWFGLHKADLDGDGDDDFIFGNLGENYKYQASPEEPFEVFYDDFDGNGKRDIVLSYYNDGQQFPLRGRSCSAEQIPELKASFPSYDAFASATLTEVFAPEALNQALQLSATTFSSMVGINDGEGRLSLRRLPTAAQFSAVRSILATDVDDDQVMDLLLHGNLYQSEIETPRADASHGLVLRGDGDGGFTTIPASRSGLQTRADVRQSAVLRSHTGQLLVVVANDGRPVFYRLR